MNWYEKTEEEKKHFSKLKIDRCKDFSEWLTKNRISHQINNNGYHIQIQIQHNFYPSTGKYYNSESGKKFHYPKFDNLAQLYKFLSKNVT